MTLSPTPLAGRSSTLFQAVPSLQKSTPDAHWYTDTTRASLFRIRAEMAATVSSSKVMGVSRSRRAHHMERDLDIVSLPVNELSW